MGSGGLLALTPLFGTGGSNHRPALYFEYKVGPRVFGLCRSYIDFVHFFE